MFLFYFMFSDNANRGDVCYSLDIKFPTGLNPRKSLCNVIKGLHSFLGALIAIELGLSWSHPMNFYRGAFFCRNNTARQTKNGFFYSPLSFSLMSLERPFFIWQI